MFRMIIACLLGAVIVGTAHAQFLHPLMEQQPLGQEPKQLLIASAVGSALLGALYGWLARMVFVKPKSR